MATITAPGNERRHLGERRSNTMQASGIASDSLSALDWTALVLLFIGGINWGLVGILNLDLVAMVFGPQSALARTVYALVGLSAPFMVYTCSKLMRKA
ncbi:MAG TPA: DUF378 domain-containing protein [Burkholderiaceae bacterium]